MTVSNPDPATAPLSAEILKVSGAFTPINATTVTVNVTTPKGTEAVKPGVRLDSTETPAMTMDSQIDVKINRLSLGKIKVGIFSYDASVDPAYVATLKDILSAYGDMEVTVMDMPVTLTLDQLTPYQVILVGGRYSSASWQADAFGDVFADYVDGGGKVIQIQNSFYSGSSGAILWKLGGRFEAQKSPVVYAGITRYTGIETLGIYNASHPIMKDVTSIIDGTRSFTDLTLQPGAQVVAYWNTGAYYVVTNRNVTVINQSLTYQYAWGGDVPVLLHNTILYLVPGDIPWLGASKTSFNLPIGQSDSTTISLDATKVTQPGKYSAWLWFNNNDPFSAGAYVPVEMDVNPDPTMIHVNGWIRTDRPDAALAKGNVKIEPPVGVAADLLTDTGGYYSFFFPATAAGAFKITASYPGYLPQTVTTAALAAGGHAQVDMTLKLDQPWLQINKDPITAKVLPGETASSTLAIGNTGQKDLTFTILEGAVIGPPGANASSLAPVKTETGPLTVDPKVQTDLANNGKADFWVRLRQSADTSQLPADLNRDAQGEYVYQSLTTVAAATQKNVVSYLNSSGLKYETHWIVNAVLVYGASAGDLQALTKLPEVVEIKGRFSAQFQAFTGTPLGIPMYGPPSINSPEWSGTAWGLEFTKADQVWGMGVKGAGIVVANIDTGVQWNHPALVEQYRGNGTVPENNYNWYPPTAAAKGACPGAADAPCDWSGHGTHTMGTMVGDDHVAGSTGHRTGMAPEAKWIACMGCDTPPNNCSDAALTACAEWIVAPTDLAGNNPDPTKRPDVVNNSWGGGHGDPWYQTYVQNWRAAGIFPSFSIGNAGPTCASAGDPGDYPESFGSGMVDINGVIDPGSSRGPGGFGDNLKPDLAAPGVAVCSSVPGNSYTCGYSGTSMASPHTSGAVALLWSAMPQLKGKITETVELLHASANPTVPTAPASCGGDDPTKVPNNTYGYGYLDALTLIQKSLIFDVPWVDETPKDGTVAPAGSSNIAITFDASKVKDGLPGVYKADLLVRHNDPLQPDVNIPLQLTVADLPALTSTNLGGPFWATKAIEFQVKAANPATGLGFTKASYTFTFGDSLLADIQSFEYNTGSAWAAMTLTQSGGDVVATMPAGTLLSLAADSSLTSGFRIAFAAPDLAVPVNVKLSDGDHAAALASLDAQANIYALPSVTSTDITGPFTVTKPGQFHMTATNPAGPQGGLIARALFRVVIKNAALADIAALNYWDGSAWQPLPLAQVGADVVGYFGPPTGMPIPPGLNVTVLFQVTFARMHNYSTNPTTLYDVQIDLLNLDLGGMSLATFSGAFQVNPLAIYVPSIFK